LTVHPIIEANAPALTELCRRYHVRRLELFGSAVTGTFDPARSDLDFVVSFGPGAQRGGFGGDYFGLRAALAALFGRQIDLVSDDSVKNPYLRAQIDAERRAVFEAAA
jgi:predicted nucleotidyltransferase